jgi:hypothetical protein
MSVEFTTPAGRIVWGHPLRPRKVVDLQTNQVRKKEDGSDREQWTFGLAIPKEECKAFFEAMQSAAAEDFPKGPPDNFAWKYKCGDSGTDGKGNPLSAKTGYAGCNIFTLSTEWQSPSYYAYNHSAGKWEDGGDDLKCGDFVRVVVDIASHKATVNLGRPGLYVNPKTVLLHERGDEIKTGEVDPNQRGFAAPPVPNSPAPPAAGQTAAAPADSTSAPPVTPHTAFLNGPKPD